MNRREFLTLAATIASGCSGARPLPHAGQVMTVQGPIDPREMGLALSHEHLLVDFTPLGEARPPYERGHVEERMLPYLAELDALGVSTFVDATPAYLGRDPLVLRGLSERSGLHVVTNTGYYGARDDAHVPEHAYADTPERLARRWIDEWRHGIGETGVRPGFIKIGVDAGSLSDIDAKLIRAAGLAHLESGLTIAAHTGPAQPAFEQLDALEEVGVHPSAWIWVHAQAEPDADAHVRAARRGAWIEFDGVSPNSTDRHVELVLNMRRHGWLSRVLVSQDAGWYRPDEPQADIRTFSTLVTEFLPALREAGLGEDEIDQLVRRNPAEAFRIGVRPGRR